MNAVKEHGVIALGLLCFCISIGGAAEVPEREIRAKLDAVFAGRAEDVRAELPALLAREPDDAGVLYLQALLTADGALAARRYEAIVERHPESIWADDALYKVYLYDYSMGLYKKADAVMDKLRTAYPRSIYVAQSAAAGSAPESGDSGPESTAGFSVQAGVFTTEAVARATAQRYTRAAGREARVKAKAAGDRTVYLVVFEGFHTKESAARFSAELKAQYRIESFVAPR